MMKRKSRPKTDPPFKKKTLASDATRYVRPEYFKQKKVSDKDFNAQLKNEYGVDDKVLIDSQKAVEAVLKNEKSGKFTNDVEDVLKMVGGSKLADNVSDFAVAASRTVGGGGETSRGDYNIHPSSVPEFARTQSDKNKAQALILSEYSKGKKEGLSDEDAMNVALSACNKGFDNAIKDYRKGNISRYGEAAKNYITPQAKPKGMIAPFLKRNLPQK